MPLDIRRFPCLESNYGFLVRDRASGQVATIDAPDGAAVLADAKAAVWTVDFVFNTHWHPDHTAGNAEVKAATGAMIVGPEEVRRVAPLDRAVSGGEAVMLGETRLEVIDTPGHTLGHVAFHAADASAVFVGDTLFPLGCGRLFEGSPEQMWKSLGRLMALPDDTDVWCAHEYGEGNARFALAVDPRPETRAAAEALLERRARGEPTVPTRIGDERTANPFVNAPALHPELAPAQAFAAVRAAKDAFKG